MLRLGTQSKRFRDFFVLGGILSVQSELEISSWWKLVLPNRVDRPKVGSHPRLLQPPASTSTIHATQAYTRTHMRRYRVCVIRFLTSTARSLRVQLGTSSDKTRTFMMVSIDGEKDVKSRNTNYEIHVSFSFFAEKLNCV